jgi:RND family efflux transporter MFP subunit
MSHRNHVLPVLSLLITVLSGAVAGCTSQRRSEPAAPETLNNVPVVDVQTGKVTDWLEAVGTVRAVQTSQVGSQMMGNIVAMDAREGDRVRRGQVLAALDDSQPRAAVEQATAAARAALEQVSVADSDFALAKATLKRYQQLYEKKSVSPQEFDEIKARFRSAEARRDKARAEQSQASAALAQARTALGYTRIRAPFPGVVTEKRVDTGTLASPGMPIFTLEDTRSYRLEVTVDESDIRLIRLGQLAPVTIDALGNAQTSGKVVQIVPAADPASRSFLVKVELPADARLRSGFFGRARFARGERSVLLIPRTSVVERGQLQGVYVLDATQIAGWRYVTLGKSAGENIEVLSGLQDGEQLVARPGNRELGGKRIAIQH